MTRRETLSDVSRLVAILADMLRSALAWEQEQNGLYAEPDKDLAQGLTGLHVCIHCLPPDDEQGSEDPHG
jgi:hypothetical protein